MQEATLAERSGKECPSMKQETGSKTLDVPPRRSHTKNWNQQSAFNTYWKEISLAGPVVECFAACGSKTCQQSRQWLRRQSHTLKTPGPIPGGPTCFFFYIPFSSNPLRAPIV